MTKRGIGVVLQPFVSEFARHIEQLTILFEACEPEHRYTALAGSEEFTGSPKLKILTRDFKTVCCIADDLKPRLSVFGKRLSI